MKTFKVLVFQKRKFPNKKSSIRELMEINYYQAEDEEEAQKYAASIRENDPDYSYLVMEVDPKDITLINNNWD